MAYLEVKKNGRVIIRRELDDAEAAKGCKVNLGPDKTVKLSTGQSAAEGEFEARIIAGNGPSAGQTDGATGNTPEEKLPRRHHPTASDQASLDVTVDADTDLPQEPPVDLDATTDADEPEPAPATAPPQQPTGPADTTGIEATVDEAEESPAPTPKTPKGQAKAAPTDKARSFEAQMSQTLDPETGAPTIEGYDIKRQLGEGAMGEVWHAVQLSTHREVAIKFMNKAKFASEKSRLRFEREVELAARLEHPNIARVYDSGLHHGGYFYAMELISGKDLDEYVEANKLSQRQILELMHTICQAVQHAHQRGVIHRDLKPSNMMVSDEGKCFVVDFGLAKTLLEDEDSRLNISQDGESTGTPAYMSPEQAAGKLDQIDVRTDVYSLGVILYRLLTGEVPHELTGSRFEFMRRVVEEEVRRPRDVCKSIDPELEALLLKALAMEPVNRYASAGDLADDITNYLTGEPLTARKATTAYFLKKRIRKHRTAVMIAAAVVLTLIGTAAYSYVKVRAERAEAIKQRGIAEVAKTDAEEQRNKAVEIAKRLAEKQAEVVRERDNAKTAQAKAEAEEAKARRALYSNQIARAHAELKQAKVAEARNVLAQCDKDLRHWEWYRLMRETNQSSRTLPGRDTGATAVVFAPGAKNLRSVSFDGFIKTWDWGSGKEAGNEVDTSTHQVVAASISSKADRLVISGVMTGPSTWDLKSGKKLSDLKPAGGALVLCVAMSPDGKIAATGGDGGRIDLWDAATGHLDKSLATGSTDATDDKDDKDARNARNATVIAFAPNGKQIAVGCKNGQVLMLSRAQELKNVYSHGTEVTSLAFSSDGKKLASGDNSGRVKQFSLEHVKSLGTIPAHTARVSAVVFSADSKRIISAGTDQLLHVWDAASNERLASLKGHSKPVAAVTVSPDGKWIISGGSDKPLRIWNSDGGNATTTLTAKPSVKTVACSPDGKLIASVDSGGLALWSVDTGRRIETQQPLKGAENGIAFLPDGKRMAGAGRYGQVTILEVATGKQLSSIAAHSGPVTCVGAGGKWLVSSGRDEVKVWDSATGKIVWEWKVAGVQCVAVSSDGRYVAAAKLDKSVYVWDLSAEKPVAREFNHGGRVETVAFSPDGKTLAAGGSDSTVRVWHLADGKLTATLTGHATSILSVAFSTDGRRIISASADTTLKIWNTQTAAVMLTLDGHDGQVTAAAVTPDGRRIVSGSLDQTLRIWDSAARTNP